MTEKPVKRARKRPSVKAKLTPKRTIEHPEIAERAYFIYLDEGRVDALDNWLRAERELTTV